MFSAVIIAIVVWQAAAVQPAMAAVPPCADVHLVWARGSGVGFGAEDDLSFARFQDDLKRRIATGVAVNSYSLGQDSGYGGYKYPAVGEWWELATAGIEWLAYNNSVDEGKNELVSYLSDRAGTCPSEKYVLAGHSQGAQVITDGLAALPQEVRNKIAYSAVFGDPTWDNGPYPIINPLDSACVQGPQ
jgi:cutinase